MTTYKMHASYGHRLGTLCKKSGTSTAITTELLKRGTYSSEGVTCAHCLKSGQFARWARDEVKPVVVEPEFQALHCCECDVHIMDLRVDIVGHIVAATLCDECDRKILDEIESDLAPTREAM